jgi:drug/metabolite transporter (DMT)-like permease
LGENFFKHRLHWVGPLACFGALVFWSIGPILIKYLAAYLDSWTQNALRYNTAALFLLPMLVFSIRQGTFDHRIWRLALVPSLANMIMQGFWASMFYHLNPAFGVLLSKTHVLWIAALSMLILPEERALLRSPRFWLGLVLALAGVVGVLYHSPEFAVSGSAKGIALALIGAVFWAAYAVSIRVYLKEVNSQSSFSVVSLYTGVGLAIAAACFGDVGQCLSLSHNLWGILILSSFLGIVCGHVCFYAAVRRLGTTIPALVILVQPFAILIMSIWVFGETLSLIQCLFGAILILGAASAIWAQKDLS